MNVMNLPCLTELEEQLASPEGDQHKADVLADLAALEQRLARQLNDLLPKEQFAQTQAIHGAVLAAVAVLKRWATGRPSSAA